MGMRVCWVGGVEKEVEEEEEEEENIWILGKRFTL